MRWILLAAALLASPTIAAPPASVAVAFDRQTVRPVLAEGEADRATHRAVGADDPVRIASISKLVTTLGVMRMVDKGQLDLDRDVSDYLGWPLRNPAFPERPITLRMLLSHRSSLIDGGELYIVPLGTTLRERLADPRVWDGAHAPGSGWFHYTNLNFPVVASVMERISGERFDRLMHRLVLKPLRLDACFNWGAGCSAKAMSLAVVLYRASGEVAKDDLHGRLPDCLVVPAADGSCDLASYRPGDNGALFSPQGGLRISMRSLARLGQMMAR
ncbi:MAG TPA: serine hydrolase, partial [Novosphingobium sp.]|nr:serine hydrolase [Novosphingobium sp.]